MKKMTVLVSVVALTGATLRGDHERTYDPVSDVGPWTWNVAEAYHNNWSPFNAYNALPTTNDTICLNDPRLTEYPLTVPAGTVAHCWNLYVPGIEKQECSSAPYLFEVNGGVLTNYWDAVIGSYYSGHSTGPRSGRVSVTSGSWTCGGEFKIAAGYTNSWLSVGAAGRLEVLKAVNVGHSDRSCGIVTNEGSFSASVLKLGRGASSTGIVVNAGTMTVQTTNLLGVGASSHAYFRNEGNLSIGGFLRIGNAKDAESEFVNAGNLSFDRMQIGCGSGTGMSIYRHLPSATITKPVADYKWFYVGYTSPGRFIVDGGTFLPPGSSERFYVGMSAPGSLELDNGGQMTFNSKIVVGEGNRSIGYVKLSNGSILKGDGGLSLGNWYWASQSAKCSTGIVDVSSSTIQLKGSTSFGGSSGSVGLMTLRDGSLLDGLGSSELLVGASAAYPGVTGVVTIADSASVVTNIKAICLGTSNAVNSGRLFIRGGRMIFAGDFCRIRLGFSGETSTGSIEGWGVIRQRDPLGTPAYMTHYGKVIADGDGVARDLDFGTLASRHDNGVDDMSNPNVIGCNGWYARNKGRLRLPHAKPFENANCHCVGDYIRLGEPTLVNSFACTFSGAEYGNYVYADLYATDRDDVPSGLPNAQTARVLSIHRAGYFSDVAVECDPVTSANFSAVRLNIRYDADAVDERSSTVSVYRHDGKEGGRWTLVGRTSYNPGSPFIQTNWLAPVDSAWNIGYIAVVARRPAGFMLAIQ